MSAHVFIAEDEASIVSLLKYNLEKEGYKVSHSENGEDALKQIKLKQPDLILMDWMLPELSGVEICKNLKKDNKFNDIPVIMLTAKGEEEERGGQAVTHHRREHLVVNKDPVRTLEEQIEVVV